LLDQENSGIVRMFRDFTRQGKLPYQNNDRNITDKFAYTKRIIICPNILHIFFLEIRWEEISINEKNRSRWISDKAPAS
jgi:hypothetical protein